MADQSQRSAPSLGARPIHATLYAARRQGDEQTHIVAESTGGQWYVTDTDEHTWRPFDPPAWESVRVLGALTIPAQAIAVCSECDAQLRTDVFVTPSGNLLCPSCATDDGEEDETHG